MANFIDGKLVSFVLRGSHFWTKEDDAWFDLVHKKYGVLSVIVPLRNQYTTYVNVVQQE